MGQTFKSCLLGLTGIALFEPNQLIKGSIHFRAEKMGIYRVTGMYKFYISLDVVEIGGIRCHAAIGSGKLISDHTTATTQMWLQQASLRLGDTCVSSKIFIDFSDLVYLFVRLESETSNNVKMWETHKGTLNLYPVIQRDFMSWNMSIDHK